MLQPPDAGGSGDRRPQEAQGSPAVRTGLDTPSKDSQGTWSQGAGSCLGFVLRARGSGLAGGWPLKAGSSCPLALENTGRNRMVPPDTAGS